MMPVVYSMFGTVGIQIAKTGHATSLSPAKTLNGSKYRPDRQILAAVQRNM